MDELNSLIERIEKAEAGSRELDAEIMCNLRKAQFREGTLYRMDKAGSTHDLVYTPAPYTTSLDAAMTLADGLSEQQIWIIWNNALKACSCAEKDMRKDVARFWCASALRARQDTTTIEGDG